MAVVTGMQEITSGERASEEFDFKGGRCGYMVIDVPNTTPDWDLELLPPGATSWQKMNVNASTKWIAQRLMIRQVVCLRVVIVSTVIHSRSELFSGVVVLVLRPGNNGGRCALLRGQGERWHGYRYQQMKL